MAITFAGILLIISAVLTLFIKSKKVSEDAVTMPMGGH